MAKPRLKYDPASGEMVPETRRTANGAIETLMSDGSWAITQAAPGPTTWTADTFDQFWRNPDQGGRFDPRAGDIFPIATPEDLVKWGFGNQSPDMTKGLTEYMPGGDLAAFQAQTQSLPFQFTDAGAVYDPSARLNPMDYIGTPDWRETAWPLMFALLSAGAASGAIGGAAAGAEGAAAGGAAGASGAGTAGSFASSFAPTITPATVAQSGLLYTGSSLPSVAGLSGVGALTAEGAAALGALGSAGAGMGLGTTGAFGPLTLNAAGEIVPQLVDLGNSLSNLSTIQAASSIPNIPTPNTSSTPSTTTPSTPAKAATSTISKIFDGTATADDWLQIGGTALSTALGYKSANDQTDAFTSLANKYLDLGAPARARLEQSYADPMSFLNGPDVQAITQQGSNAAARALSTQYGNPALQPTAWNELNKINTNNQWNQLYNYRNQLAAQGGLGVGPASSFDMNAAGTSGNAMNVVGAGIGALTNPQKSILDQMRELAGMNTGGLFGTSVQRV